MSWLQRPREAFASNDVALLGSLVALPPKSHAEKKRLLIDNSQIPVAARTNLLTRFAVNDCRWPTQAFAVSGCMYFAPRMLYHV